MPFHKVTWHQQKRFATVHNFGCTFACPVCSYKLRSGADGKPGHAWPTPERFLSMEDIREALQSVDIDTLYVMGGEPTTARELPELLAFGKHKLGCRTVLGHTNGSLLPMDNLDGANVGLKAFDDEVHRRYTGRERSTIVENVERAFAAGIELRTNMVYIPGLVELDQIEATVQWLASMSRDIHFHLCGYIPVPGQPYNRPTDQQMTRALEVCRTHLDDVSSSHLTSEQALDLSSRDSRFAVTRLL